MRDRECIRILESHGWRCVRQRGSHMQFKNPAFPGVLVTVPSHRGDLKLKTLRSIFKTAGLLHLLK